MRMIALMPAPAAIVAVLALAACGSGAGPSASATTGAGDTSAGLRFAGCMRSHGLPHFPDPGAPAPAGNVISILGSKLPPNTNVRAPAFQAAMNTCMKLLGAGHPKAAPSAADRAEALAFSKCMRTHGVPNFPDPVFMSNGRIGVGIGQGNDANSPGFRKAEQTCGRR